MESYCLGAGVAVDEWLTEIGGGLDFKRTVFLALMERIENRDIAHLLIAHRDRLTRFGFDWFEHFAPTARLHHHGGQPGKPVPAGGDG